jgi:hypothetical protein
MFREQDHTFRRTSADQSWDNAARTLDPMLERAHAHRPYAIDDEAGARNDLPDGLMRPILAVPVGDQLRCLGLALYGPHGTGNALSHDERSMLAELADKAASVFMKIGDEQLRSRIKSNSGLSQGDRNIPRDRPSNCHKQTSRAWRSSGF